MSEHAMELLACVIMGSAITSLAIFAIVAVVRVQPIDIEERKQFERTISDLRRSLREVKND